ncbi:LCP family protein [Fictibacillus nanhaiensis]|uniref:LCP family glycopolymer transferase n=1 Tax=Fictibacillus nanhaiensis TaxID=742169 RepID=UPI001C97C24B|nr:LCP family protein [Fictibacillus nanhaiensis]MBY6037101.1 LCP family protein [Fictibacillus nanhaiensis]
MSTSRANNRKKKRHKVLLILMSVVFVLLIASLAFGYNLYSQIKSTAGEMHEENGWKGKGNQKEKIASKKPISILLMGVDERENDKGRSDSLVVITLNPNKQSMFMFNIPRDTRTLMVGKGTQDKINHSYAFGGSKMTVETVENFLDVPLDYYIKVNMEALSEIVDAVGGITVNNKNDWYDDRYYKKGYHYKKGEITLNGPQSLGYVRMRYQDKRGDFGRQERQRQVINAIIDKGARASSLTKFNDVLNVLGKHVKTNMTFSEMKDIQKNYSGARKTSNSFEIKGSGQKINGIYFYVVPPEEKARITTTLKEHLDL